MKINVQTLFFQNGIFEIFAVLNRGVDIIVSLVSADSKNRDVIEGFGELQ